MAFGVKYKLRPRLNLMAEFAMTKVFGDHVDGPQLSDLYTIKSSFLKNTDWYSTIMITISYDSASGAPLAIMWTDFPI